jgi:hypothetical protein
MPARPPQRVDLVDRQRPVLPDPNRRVRSGSTPPKRKKFETRAGSAPRNVLNCLTSHNLTKMAVVQLRQRNWPERGAKRPETGARATASGSEISPRMPKFCAVPAIGRASKRMSRLGVLADRQEPGSNILFLVFQRVRMYLGGVGARPAKRSSIRTSSRAATPTSWCAATPPPEITTRVLAPSKPGAGYWPVCSRATSARTWSAALGKGPARPGKPGSGVSSLATTSSS